MHSSWLLITVLSPFHCGDFPHLLQAKFVERAQALLHGDMHTGSLMVTYAIDAEFAVYGPIAFDVGKFIANLLLAFFALDGHSSQANPRKEQRTWLVQVMMKLTDVYLSESWGKARSLVDNRCASPCL